MHKRSNPISFSLIFATFYYSFQSIITALKKKDDRNGCIFCFPDIE
ncbi:MAG: hypothetical protein H6Q21_135 [Bacteroidetes bacterium]|nr:hypothetical protein [Bacteroidota bacterium]